MGENPFYDAIDNQMIQQKRDCLIFITGNRGTGKSQLGNKIMFDKDKSYREGDPQKLVRIRIIRDIMPFLDLVESGHLPEGTAIMFDEVGVGAAAREWYSYVNIALSKLIQISRYRRYLIIFTAPSFRFVDSQLRQMFSFMIITQRVNHSQNITKAKVFKINYDKVKGDEPFKRHFINSKGEKIKKWRFKKVSTRWFNAYEKYSREFKDVMIKEIRTGVGDRKLLELAKKNKRKIDKNELALEMANKYPDGNATITRIAVDCEIPNHTAREVKVIMQDILKVRAA